MKKLFVTTLAILTCGAAYALPVGNPSEASLFCDGIFWCGSGGCCDPCNPCGSWCDSFNFRVGFYGDYVFNRDLEQKGRERNRGAGRKHVLDHTAIHTNAAYLALNLCNRFDVFATLGVSDLDLEGNVSSFSPFFPFTGGAAPFLAAANGSRLEVETSSEFSWSVGGRITLWECGCTALGIEGQYFRTNPRVKRVTWASLGSTYPSATTPRLRTEYSEWQVGLGISHRINILVPYIAVKWSGSELQWQGRQRTPQFPDFPQLFQVDNIGFIGLNNLVNHKSWGYAVGVSLVDCGKAAVTAEGRFGDEKAFYINGQVRF